ncbi:MAG: ABC transporter permease subunit [Oligoflexales bacterium]|nr:ABC transporter permease subunit [Oligoflexales bacterium]
MSKVWLIAQRELMSYFSTWMGYIIITAAVLIDGLLFNAFAVGGVPKYSSVVLEDFFFLSSGMAMVAAIFLAMRLLAEEKQTGTIVLYFTSPISERQIVYGKFLSSLIFFLILQILTLHLPALIFLEGKVSYGHIAAGYFGTILLGASVLALTLFASVISPNQMVAGILGASMTVVLLVLWIVSAVVDQPFRDIFSYLALHNKHFLPFSRGMVHIRDIVFYISVILFFLECSVRALEGRRLRG